jgi:hypothetical protein
LDARNHQANAKIATMVGATIASMIAIESIRIDFSAAPIGPCGARIPVQPDSAREHSMIAVRHPAIRNFDLVECIPKFRRLPNWPSSGYTSDRGNA